MEKFSSRVHTLFFLHNVLAPPPVVCLFPYFLTDKHDDRPSSLFRYIYLYERETPHRDGTEKRMSAKGREVKKAVGRRNPPLFYFFSLSDEHSGASSSYIWFSRGPSGVPDSVVMIMTLCEHTY